MEQPSIIPELLDRLIKLNAELIVRDEMPLIDPKTYPENMPEIWKNFMIEQAKKVENQIKLWASELSAIRRELKEL